MLKIKTTCKTLRVRDLKINDIIIYSLDQYGNSIRPYVGQVTQVKYPNGTIEKAIDILYEPTGEEVGHFYIFDLSEEDNFCILLKPADASR